MVIASQVNRGLKLNVGRRGANKTVLAGAFKSGCDFRIDRF